MKIEVDTSTAHDKYWLRSVIEDVIEKGGRLTVIVEALEVTGPPRTENAVSRPDAVGVRTQVLDFVEGGCITEGDKGDIFHTVTMQRLFELYLSWCGKKDLVPCCRNLSPFARKLLALKPEWRERIARPYTPEGKRKSLVGIRVNWEEGLL